MNNMMEERGVYINTHPLSAKSPYNEHLMSNTKCTQMDT